MCNTSSIPTYPTYPLYGQSEKGVCQSPASGEQHLPSNQTIQRKMKYNFSPAKEVGGEEGCIGVLPEGDETWGR